MPKKNGNKNAKPKVGFYDLTGCNGCLLSVLFNEKEILELLSHIDIKTFRFIKEIKEEKDFDIVFMEGLVASNDDLEKLKSMRSKTKLLVALGTCACTGCIPAYRNFIDNSKFEYLVYDKVKELVDQQPTPINSHVEVDFYLHGCPPSKQQILDFIKDVLLGKKPDDYDRPVCFECKLNENRCLLDEGKMCFGPITRGGCNSVCCNGKLECWGCRGMTPDADINLMIKLLEEKGFTKEHIKQRLRTFAGMQIEMPPPYKPVKIKNVPVKKPVKKVVKNKKVVKPAKKVKKTPVEKKKAVKSLKKKSAKKKLVNKKSAKKKSAKKKSAKKKSAKKKSAKKKSAKKKSAKKKPAKKKIVKKKKPVTSVKKKAAKKPVKTSSKKFKKKAAKKPAKTSSKKKVAKKQTKKKPGTKAVKKRQVKTLNNPNRLKSAFKKLKR